MGGSLRKSPFTEQMAQEPVSTSTAAFVLELGMFVRWSSVTGKQRSTHLNLRALKSLDSLKGLPRDLVQRAYQDNAIPEYFSSEEYLQFTPEEECLSLPGDVASTDFRLVATHEGWEYVVYERTHNPQASDSILKVSVVEFESTALLIGQLGVRISLVAFPIISINRAWLQNLALQLTSNPHYQGILS